MNIHVSQFLKTAVIWLSIVVLIIAGLLVGEKFGEVWMGIGALLGCGIGVGAVFTVWPKIWRS